MKIVAFFLLLCLAPSWSVGASDYSDGWGLPVDSTIPLLNFTDQAGEPRSFDDLKGRNGLLLFFNRSADW